MRSKNSVFENIRYGLSLFWTAILTIQAFLMVAPVQIDKLPAVARMALSLPVIFSIPLFVLSILEVCRGKKFIRDNLFVMMMADIAAMLIYAFVSVCWSLFAFIIGAFAEGVGDFPYAIAVNEAYIFVLPLIVIVSIVLHIVTYFKVK